jgi:hypothetical protein
MTTPRDNQPLMAPAMMGGGIVAGISAGLIGIYQLGDCLAYKTKRGECDQIAMVAIPAFVAGVGSIAGAMGGLWTFNPRLRSGSTARRDERGRFTGEP